MKIFAKKIANKFLSIFFDGRPKTVEPKSQEEMDQLVDLIKEASAGNQEATDSLKETLFNQKREGVLSEIQEVAGEIESLDTELSLKEKYHEVLKEYFEIVTEGSVTKLYLKGFKAEIPPLLADRFVKEVTLGNSIQPLINFWKLTLTNPNPEARRGLYNFIKKQKLILTDAGYFVAFRQVIKASPQLFDAKIQELDPKVIQGFVEKVKKQKKGLRNYYVAQTKDGLALVPVKSKKKSTLPSGSKIGYLKDVAQAIKNSSSKKTIEETFTDDYTKKMVIKIGEPVRIPRSECDENADLTCSKGLHVGTQNFVLGGGFGNTIVACLINPQHVVSVPYKDAEKMRVCEYYPFTKLTREELKNFHKVDLKNYIQQYRRLESKKMKKALTVLDDLRDSERRLFESEIQNEESERLLVEKKEALLKKQGELAQILEDDISTVLDYDEIRSIIASRIV